jgi:hypothetical protein
MFWSDSWIHSGKAVGMTYEEAFKIMLKALGKNVKSYTEEETEALEFIREQDLKVEIEELINIAEHPQTIEFTSKDGKYIICTIDGEYMHVYPHNYRLTSEDIEHVNTQLRKRGLIEDNPFDPDNI